MRVENPTTRDAVELPAGAVAALTAGLRGQVLADPLSRALYSTDASIFQISPAVVVVPRDEADVVQAVRLAGRLGLTLAARGAASGLAGECLTPGVALDMSRYCTGILEVDVPSRAAVVQAGCVLRRLNEDLAGPAVETITTPLPEMVDPTGTQTEKLTTENTEGTENPGEETK